MSDSAVCFAATAARPDRQGPRDKLVANFDPIHRSESSAETNDQSLVIGAFRMANSTQNGLGCISGHHEL
ncbi:MAG: hypothetical protein ACJAQZ_004568 [Planctomycetota bacterium]|jgi:hypothetical protein